MHDMSSRVDVAEGKVLPPKDKDLGEGGSASQMLGYVKDVQKNLDLLKEEIDTKLDKKLDRQTGDDRLDDLPVRE